MLQAVTFADGTTAFIQHNKADVKFTEGQTLTLEDGTTAVVQNMTPREPPQEQQQATHKIVEGQPIQLEDGTMAYLQTTKGPDGLQAITLEDGTTAYIAHPNPDALFAEATGLDGTLPNLEQMTQVTQSPELSEEGEIKAETNDPGTIRIVDRDNQERTLPFGDKAFRCMYGNCGRLYTTLHHLKVHERSHTGDRPFKCDFLQCGKAFATGYGLKSHRRVHTGEKPYKCSDGNCDKAFKTSGDLQKHVRTHTGERPFKCPFEGCTRSFTTSNIRKVHIRTHTGERPYTCSAEGCGRSFASATNYKNHVRIHTGEKPYVCTVQGCGKRFTEYSSLYKHHVVHTHSKPYECTHCGKTYRQTSTLAMHKRTAHGEEIAIHEAEAQLFTQVEGDESDPKRPRLQYIATAESSSGQEEGEGMLVINTSEASQVSNLENVQLVPDDQAHTIQVSLPCLQQLEQQHTISGFTINEQGQQVLVVTDPIQLEALQASLQHLTGTAQIEGVDCSAVLSTTTTTTSPADTILPETDTTSTDITNTTDTSSLVTVKVEL
ncbi:hypothetical protein SNE40_003140 [Patella caerulea]|uniref:C2H2-type domain-containing protein n=1 Tax=Patella caerulea TaxID=87958 RepID=A0AAN8K2D8_PATCE